MLVKPLSAATWKWYDNAVETGAHENNTVNGRPVVPFEGARRFGPLYVFEARVINLNEGDHPLAPPEFLALTLQKYLLLYCNPETAWRESVINESFEIYAANVESAES